jgi:hypothetical protein
MLLRSRTGSCFMMGGAAGAAAFAGCLRCPGRPSPKPTRASKGPALQPRTARSASAAACGAGRAATRRDAGVQARHERALGAAAAGLQQLQVGQRGAVQAQRARVRRVRRDLAAVG